MFQILIILVKLRSEIEESPLSILKGNTREMKHPVLAHVTQGDLLPKLKPLTYRYRGSPEVRILCT